MESNMNLPQILELVEKRVKEKVKKESFGIFVTPECYFRLKDFLCAEITLAYNQGLEEGKKLK